MWYISGVNNNKNDMEIKESWIIWYKHVLSHLVLTEYGSYLVSTLENRYETISSEYANELIENISNE